MHISPIHLILLAILLIPLCFFCKRQSEITFKVEKIAELPQVSSNTPNPGVAGAFSGITGDKLIIAGGANFPEKRPWDGGVKTFHSRVYIYSLSGQGPKLIDGNWSFPNARAYGASVSLPDGVLTIGGNDREKCYQSVLLLKWDASANDLNFEKFPDLPVPLSYSSAVLLGNCVYLIGGSGSPDAIDTGNFFLRLDLSKRNTAEFNWETLSPFPGLGRVFAVTAVQSNGVNPCIFLFSGRNVSKQNEIKVFQDGLVYDPKLQKWETLPSYSTDDFPVMAGTAFPVGRSGIAFAGGASKELLFREIELKKQLTSSIGTRDTALISQSKLALIAFYTQHPGFSKNILVYNTMTKTVALAGKFDRFCPVTTIAVPYKKGVIIPCGEIKPGIRTPDILRISTGSLIKF